MNSVTDNKSPLELDRERVTCLLLINTQLMKKAVNIYHNILSNQQSLQQLPQQSRQSIIDSYQNCTRRIHCNLSVLSHLHEKYHNDPSQQPPLQNKATFPIIMSAPQDMPELTQIYTKLQELYPEALQFLKLKIQQMRKQAQFQQQQQQPSTQSPSVTNQQQLLQQSVNNMQQFPIIMNQSPMVKGPTMVNQSSMINTPGSNPNNTPNLNQENPADFLQPLNFANTFNPQNSNNYDNNVNNLQTQQVQQQQQSQMQAQALSPQQILQQMNTGASSNNMNNNARMMDFF